jgi:hypothetical protein
VVTLNEVARAQIATLLPASGTASLSTIAVATGRCRMLILTPARWGLPRIANGGRALVLPDGLTFVTTQDQVDVRVVRHQLGLSDLGFGLPGEPKLLAVYRNPGDPQLVRRLFDGHHALAARLLAGLPLEGYEHGPGRGGIDPTINPPKLTRPRI